MKMTELRKVAKELNEKLDLTPRIKQVGIITDEITRQILEAAELILPSDNITENTKNILDTLTKEGKQEKKTKGDTKEKNKRAKPKVKVKVTNKTNRYDLMFKKVKVNKRIVKIRDTYPDNTPDNANYDVRWESQKESFPWKGWVIGYRNKMEGIRRDNDFTHKNTVKCVLVIKNATSNPIPVPMDGFTLLKTLLKNNN